MAILNSGFLKCNTTVTNENLISSIVGMVNITPLHLSVLHPIEVEFLECRLSNFPKDGNILPLGLILVLNNSFLKE